MTQIEALIELTAPRTSKEPKMNTEKQAIKALLAAKLGDKFPFDVVEQTTCFGDSYLKIWFSCSRTLINGVSFQMPQVMSFSLSAKLELKVQHYGCCGGRDIYRKPNLQDDKEKFYAMISLPVPFRTPRPEMPKVLNCLSKFIDNYIQILRDNVDTLTHPDLVDYKALLA